MFRTQVFQVGPLQVFLEGVDPTIVERFEPLFDGFENTAMTKAAEPITISATVDGDAAPKFEAHFEGQQLGSAATQHELELAMTRKLNRAVLDAEIDLLHLHAGAVHRNGVTLLIIGSSMAGKSTLVAKLVTEGWQYLSDEQLAVQRNGAVVSFPRAITLRQRSWPLFDLEFPAVTSAADRIEVSPRTLGQVYAGEPLVPDIIVRPDVGIEDSIVERLSIAEALSVLIEDSLDLERSGEAGMQAMLAIISAAPAFRVAGQDLAHTLAAIDDLCSSASPPGPVLEQESVSPDERSDRVSGSQSWLFADGSSALFEPASGALVRVDEAGYRAWQQLAAAPEHWPAELASSHFVTGLGEAGLLMARP